MSMPSWESILAANQQPEEVPSQVWEDLQHVEINVKETQTKLFRRNHAAEKIKLKQDERDEKARRKQTRAAEKERERSREYDEQQKKLTMIQEKEDKDRAQRDALFGEKTPAEKTAAKKRALETRRRRQR